MSFILNQYEVEDAARQHIHGAKCLLRFVDMINENSDGWGTWKSAANAATQLQVIVSRRIQPEQKMITRALAPMKALCTRKGLPQDWILGDF